MSADNMPSQDQDIQWMARALVLAEEASQHDEVPVGAVLVKENQALALSGNECLQRCDPTAHAEMLVLRTAITELKKQYLHGTTLYITLEPCLMCLGAIIHLQVQRVIFGAYDSKRGAMGSALDILQLPGVEYHPDIFGGVLREKSCQLLRNFFQHKRRKLPLF